MIANEKRAAGRQTGEPQTRDDEAKRPPHHTQHHAASPQILGCMCGSCGDPDNDPRPHNLASVGPHPHLTEDLFEWLRGHRRFNRQQLDASCPRWAITPESISAALGRLQRRGLILYRFDRQAKVYVVYWVKGENDAHSEVAS